MTEIFIKGNFPSFKNSKQYTGKYFIMSKTVQKYLKNYEYQWKTPPKEFSNLVGRNFPMQIGFHFIRGTRHRWDFHNMVQGCADLMVKHGWIPDDNMNYFLPFPLEINGKFYEYNKENPGVIIKIL